VVAMKRHGKAKLVQNKCDKKRPFQASQHDCAHPGTKLQDKKIETTGALQRKMSPRPGMNQLCTKVLEQRYTSTPTTKHSILNYATLAPSKRERRLESLCGKHRKHQGDDSDCLCCRQATRLYTRRLVTHARHQPHQAFTVTSHLSAPSNICR